MRTRRNRYGALRSPGRKRAMARGSREDRHDSQSRPDGVLSPLQPFYPAAILATLERHRVAFVVIGAYAAVTQG